MLIYLLQLREASRGSPGVLLFFGVFASTVWIVWALKAGISRRYRPWTIPHETTVSVVIPVVDEPVDLFREVLLRILKQSPEEVIVVINGAKNLALEEVCEQVGATWCWTETPGKRNAVRIGVEQATGDVVALVDSDTVWTDDTLVELLKPFADPRIGGVTTRQRIMKPRRCFLTKWADWMENSRALYSMPAQSVFGQVGCLPGRTIAFRRSILDQVMDDFMTQRFMGVFLEVSDDRTLTNLALKLGYRTAYQSTSLVYTDSPVRLKKLFRQHLRWARGSQYNTMRMTPWMLAHAPMLAFFFLVDIILPFLFLGTVLSWTYHTITHSGVNFMEPLLRAHPGATGWLLIGSLLVVGSTLSMWIRQRRHLVEQPKDYAWMPAFVLFSTFFLMPVRLLGFLRMAHASGWGTRKNAYVGGTDGINPWGVIPYLLFVAVLGAELAAITAF